jgi:hypothetical protein
MGKSGNPARAAEQAAQKASAPVEPISEDLHDENSVEDFDAFWASRERRGKTTTIMGRTVELPPALPLQFEMEARRLERSKREKDVHRLVAILFGPDALDHWRKAGMDAEQFAVLLAWAPQVVAGNDVTLAEVADAVAKAEAAQESGANPH